MKSVLSVLVVFAYASAALADITISAVHAPSRNFSGNAWSDSGNEPFGASNVQDGSWSITQSVSRATVQVNSTFSPTLIDWNFVENVHLLGPFDGVNSRFEFQVFFVLNQPEWVDFSFAGGIGGLRGPQDISGPAVPQGVSLLQPGSYFAELHNTFFLGNTVFEAFATFTSSLRLAVVPSPNVVFMVLPGLAMFGVRRRGE